MSLLTRYTKAMVAGNIDTCIAIEQQYGVFGYPPEWVSVALSAIDDGRDPDAALESYLSGDTPPAGEGGERG